MYAQILIDFWCIKGVLDVLFLWRGQVIFDGGELGKKAKLLLTLYLANASLNATKLHT